MKLGTKVKVVECFHGHEFEVGETVVLVDTTEDINSSLFTNNKGDDWFLAPDEYVVIREYENKEQAISEIEDVLWNAYPLAGTYKDMAEALWSAGYRKQKEG